MDLGAVVEFRFGEQIDHSAIRDRIRCPQDMEKWARICMNIIRHYNEGWADGKHWNITDWSVWEEPNNLSLFRGSGKNYWESYPEYFKLYATVAKMIRKEFPNLKIDTHRDNYPMQKSLKKNGFEYCGIIYLADGNERLAFQKSIKKERF